MGQVNCELLVEVREAWLYMYNTKSMCYEALLCLGLEDWQLTPQLRIQILTHRPLPESMSCFERLSHHLLQLPSPQRIISSFARLLAHSMKCTRGNVPSS